MLISLSAPLCSSSHESLTSWVESHVVYIAALYSKTLSPTFSISTSATLDFSIIWWGLLLENGDGQSTRNRVFNFPLIFLIDGMEHASVVSTSRSKSDSEFLSITGPCSVKNKPWICEDCGEDSRGDRGREQRAKANYLCSLHYMFCSGEKHTYTSPRTTHRPCWHSDKSEVLLHISQQV